MSAVGSHLKIQSMGDAVLGVKLFGDRNKPEPIHFRVVFPGGDIDVVRTSDGEYWAHFRVNHPDDGGCTDRLFGRLVDARMDFTEPRAAKANLGDFSDPALYHLAMRVARRKEFEAPQ